VFLGMLSFSEFFGNAFGFEHTGLASALFEFIDGAGDIQQILLAGVERMAIGANFNMEFLFGGTRFECMSASTNYFGVGEICRVEILFHTLVEDNRLRFEIK
jgi:hypothetical protein